MSERTNPRRAAASRENAPARRWDLLKSLLRCRCGMPLLTPVEVRTRICRRCANPPKKSGAKARA